MEKEQILRIIEEEVSGNFTVLSFANVRFRITYSICEERVRPLLSDDNWDLFSKTVSSEHKLNIFRFVMFNRQGGFYVDTELAEKFLLLYEECQEFCEFVLGQYDAGPEYLKARLPKDNFLVLAAHLQTEREGIYKDFVEDSGTNFNVDRIQAFESLICWVRFILIGEEQYCQLLAEANDAFAVVRSHPKCAKFFSHD